MIYCARMFCKSFSTIEAGDFIVRGRMEKRGRKKREEEKRKEEGGAKTRGEESWTMSFNILFRSLN